MRIVSWNVWWRFGDRWRQRQNGIISTLQNLRADVIGLQETWASQAKALGEQLEMHHAVGAPSLPPAPKPGTDVAVAILSRWPVLNTKEHRLASVNRDDPVALHVTLDHPMAPLHIFNSCV